MPEYVNCYYCGEQIKTKESHNADDWIDPDTIGKRCCGICNDTIVIPNRIYAITGKEGEKNGHKSNT